MRRLSPSATMSCFTARSPYTSSRHANNRDPIGHETQFPCCLLPSDSSPRGSPSLPRASGSATSGWGCFCMTLPAQVPGETLVYTHSEWMPLDDAESLKYAVPSIVSTAHLHGRGLCMPCPVHALCMPCACPVHALCILCAHACPVRG